MFEVRVDNNTVEFSSDLRDALIGAIDFISGREDNSLNSLYRLYRNYTCEDLIEVIEENTDKKIELIVNTMPYSKLIVKQEFLTIGE
ncbi:phage protein [Streptococcus pseudoporcinus]|uniref:Phage protein n=1 Tax=Streptococcus pseudoporcinus TaxID=361101 RepID=A0A4U9XKW2_9STRE|nr:hypothetical protein [Streptococcus pseudoporcinus]QBX18695.1 hypothetical protein Javan443_0021 [Streptococcus phage Javan443]QBX18786.1 hypothetical protein Javan445_0046 [Streptococcus phage Javan445]VTS14020.1 phage protein [Streptococcus pseudoporcinus]VTS19558.1 phage protein [Streptococcus pseudoporcinus]VUC69764.1 phage protein [Streptococcus pseudoporcinus]